MIPYGISDYKALRASGMYYIDKTPFIPLLERQPRHLFLIRPRRFGKSLFVSMLEAYYDIGYGAEFDELFRGAYIHEHPTEERNSYHVLRFDFSAVDSHEAHANFNVYANQRLQSFVKKNGFSLRLDDVNVNNNLNKLFDYCHLNGHPLFILIDEYDNFINELLVRGEAEYRQMVTGQEALYKQFFRTLKAGTSGTDAPVKRMFITGVSPLALFDVTSGYNIGANITTDAGFNDLLGVTREELSRILRHYGLEEQQEAIFSRMEEWYNGYKFSRKAAHTIFNTDMALYYLRSLIQNKEEPAELIDLNVRSDYTKIRFLTQTDRELNGNFSVLNELLASGKVHALSIADNFSAFEVRRRENFISLLFYLGLITIEKYESLRFTFKIPNQTIHKILAEFIRKALEEQAVFEISIHAFSEKLRLFSTRQDLSVFHWLGEQVNAHSRLRDYISGESFLKGFLAAYLSIAPFYEVVTEKEAGKGFVDIYLRPTIPEAPYGAGIELKYIKRNELTDEVLERKTEEAWSQLQRYALPENTVKVILVFHGWELTRVLDAREYVPGG
ncbi:MAG: AAA family ATPase [Lewinellaceae bacterium]|nr:AAA family ATPase [Lewinellaceae bacterium]